MTGLRRGGLLWFALAFATALAAQEIQLVYPRQSLERPFAYPDAVDSTFILGSIHPPAGTLRVNGVEIVYRASGAFLAWLPLRKTNGEQSWNLTLDVNSQVADAETFPYVFESDLAGREPPDRPGSETAPRVLRVTQPAAHTRLTPAGTYHLFPAIDCRLRVSGRQGAFYRVDLGAGLEGLIEERFVEADGDSILPPAVLGNGECTRSGGDSRCVLALSRVVPWTAELSADQRTLVVTLFDTRLGNDRIRYTAADPLLREVFREQLPHGVRLELRCQRPLRSGYELEWTGGKLQIRLRGAIPRSDRTLRGKRIVIDPGHGGRAFGAVGPLGTREKDVTLRWAQILTAELRRHGADVQLTRTADVELGLYERIADAHRQRADFFVSLHANALPDGVNPFVRRGTGTYYYHTASRHAAEILHRRIVRAVRLRDDGLFDADLAVVRPTAFPAVLLEPAYLIHPEEEELLRSDAFLRTLSRAIVRGLREYFESEL